MEIIFRIVALSRSNESLIRNLKPFDHPECRLDHDLLTSFFGGCCPSMLHDKHSEADPHTTEGQCHLLYFGPCARKHQKHKKIKHTLITQSENLVFFVAASTAQNYKTKSNSETVIKSAACLRCLHGEAALAANWIMTLKILRSAQPAALEVNL